MSQMDNAMLIVGGILMLFLFPAFSVLLMTLSTGDILLRWNMIYVVFVSAMFIAAVMILGAWLDGFN